MTEENDDEGLFDRVENVLDKIRTKAKKDHGHEGVERVGKAIHRYDKSRLFVALLK